MILIHHKKIRQIKEMISNSLANHLEFSSMQQDILRFFDSFQQKEPTEQWKQEACALGDEMERHLVHPACDWEKDMAQILRHVTFSSLTSAASLFSQELKLRSISSEFAKSPAVMILRLVSAYMSNYGTEQVVSNIMTELYDKATSNSVDDNIRAIICWWIGNFIVDIADMLQSDNSTTTDEHEHTRKEDNSQHLTKCLHLLIRMLEDKSQKIRCAASFASCYVLQMHQYPILMNHLVASMANDSSSHNRCAIISNIPITDQILSPLVKRIRDVNVKVRIDAIQALKTIDVLQLTPTQRIDILKYGLTPRCMETFRKAVDLLCCSWLKSMKFDPIALVRLLEPSCMNEDVCNLATRIILAVALGPDFNFVDESLVDGGAFSARGPKSLTCTFTKQMVEQLHSFQNVLSHELSEHEIRFFKEKINGITVDLSGSRTSRDGEINALGLDASSSLYIRLHCQVILKAKNLSELQKSNRLSRVLPDVPTLGVILININQSIQDNLKDDDLESSFIDDDDDPLQTEKDLIFTCRQLFHLLQCIDLTEEGSRRHFLDILRDMLCSIETHADIIESSVIAMRDLYDSDVTFIEVIAKILSDVHAKYPESLRELTDVHRLDVLSTALSRCSSKVTSLTLFDSFSSFILHMIVREEAEFREVAVECLGRYTLLLDEKQVLDTYLPLLIEISRNSLESDEVRAQALIALCDLSFRFQSILSPINVDGQPSTSYLRILEDLLISRSSSLLNVAAECIAKLHFVGRVHDSNLLAHLLIIYFDHDSMHENMHGMDVSIGSPLRLQQLLTVFFPVYGSQIGKDALVKSVKVVENLLNQRSNKKEKKSTMFPHPKLIHFIHTCTENADVE